MKQKRLTLNTLINLKNKGRKSKLNKDLKEFIKDKLESKWSPKHIIGRCFYDNISLKKIYNWLYRGLLGLSSQVLRRKGKTLKSKETRDKFNIEKSISKRANIVKKRIEFSHLQ